MPPVDIHAKFQNARRAAAWLACPLCDEEFATGSKLWIHAKSVHAQSAVVAGCTDEVEAKRQFLQIKAGTTTNKVTRARSRHKQPSSIQHEYADTSAADEDVRRPLAQPSSPPEYTQIPERGNGEDRISTLARQQWSGPQDTLGSTLSPRNRAVEDRFNEAGNPGGSYDPGNTKSKSLQLRDAEFERDTFGQKKELWVPWTDITASKEPSRAGDRLYLDEGGRSHASKPHTSPQPPQLEHSRRTPSSDSLPVDEDEPELQMLLQPETRPISHEQLVIEVKGIYAGLSMVEAKCIDIDERQSAAAQEKDLAKRDQLTNDQWQSLIALHKQLLHEHHDFFLASQHPSATPALSRLAAKYSMPARMWRHGIHAFLEVLRHRLPGSLEHMLAFIYIAYTMMALLYETVSTFEDTWIECLGDLGRYRMAIEDDEPKDREIWSNVAQLWYNKAADKSPNVGRLCHHKAILAPPYSLEQLSLYLRALTSVIPFDSARGSIRTLFNPILDVRDTSHRRASSLDTVFIRAHGILFTGQFPGSMDQFNSALDELGNGGLLDMYITKVASKFKETGVYAAISNIAALFEYGTPKQIAAKPRLRHAFENAQRLKGQVPKPFHVNTIDSANQPPSIEVSKPEAEQESPPASESTRLFISGSSRLASITLDISLKRIKDRNVYPLVHVYLMFIWSLIIVQEAWEWVENDVVWKIIERDMPWMAICHFLNFITDETKVIAEKIRSAQFPQPENEYGRPLIEDYLMRGQMFAQWILPNTWFTDKVVDIDERKHDPPSMAQPRMERILWLGHRIASVRRWIFYDMKAKKFATTDFVNDELNTTTMTEPATVEVDSLMSDGGVTFYTPESTSITTSESHDSDVQYTPQSTSLASSETNEEVASSTFSPMDLVTPDVPPGPSTPRTTDFDKVTEDAPMVDISPTKPMSSPTLANLEEKRHFSDPGKLRSCAEYDEWGDAETYKP